jgi:hypothetical protein
MRCAMMIDIPRRPLTVDDYARMREAGIFGEDVVAQRMVGVQIEVEQVFG